MLGRCPVSRGEPGRGRRRSAAVLDDPGELVGVERGPADERAVDLGHRHERRRCCPASRCRRTGCGPPRRSRRRSGRAARRGSTPIVVVGVLGRGVAAGADRPDRLVGDARTSAASAAFTPANAPRVCDVTRSAVAPGFALLERLPHAHDRRHAVLHARPAASVHRLVGLAEELPALRVPDDHVAAR